MPNIGLSAAKGLDVVCERFNSSTFAYQAVAGGLDETQVLSLLRSWCGAPSPDLTVILDLDARVALARRNQPGDRIEDRGLKFQESVARGYRRYAELDPGARLVAADAAQEIVHQRVLACVEHWLAEARARG